MFDEAEFVLDRHDRLPHADAVEVEDAGQPAEPRRRATNRARVGGVSAVGWRHGGPRVVRIDRPSVARLADVASPTDSALALRVAALVKCPPC